ncbi:efflux RND transporter periplasmic adaptor subunit [Burkholderia multivorans]|uniref:efflux RND transporter periplasmic adaptor subunit n=1 Tax=Burkholderia multivorans TaxID=87883 RepID=UPI0020B262D6|nr:efflux RND transporter periplasmic adaptor subunit [Burkholderia multivorans]
MLTACGEHAGTTAVQTPEVGVVTVRQSAVPIVVELPGRVSAWRVAEVRARVDGIVFSRKFVEGSEVKAGQTLYQIDPAPYIAALDSAKATLAKAEASLVSAHAQAERYRVLVASSAISRQDYDNAVAAEGEARADVAAGKAAVETARINLGYTNVISPISGRIGKSSVTEGAYVQSSAATLLATVQQLDPVYVDLTQSSVDGLKLRRDAQEGRLKTDGPHAAKVTLILEDGRPYGEAGKLEFSDVTVDQTTGSVTVRGLFQNPQRVLLPGMYVRAKIEEGIDEQAFLVPQQGVTHDQKGNPTALVVGADGKVVLRQLVTAGTYGSSWIVESGLQSGDRVIVQGVDKVQPGATVKAVAAQLPQQQSMAGSEVAAAARVSAASGTVAQ